MQARKQLGEPPVELLERQGIAGHIPAMTEQGIEVDEVGKQESAVRKVLAALQGAVEQCVVTMRRKHLSGAAMREDVADLAYAYDGAPRVRSSVQQCRPRRRRHVVTPIAGARKPGCAVAYEGPRDHARDVQECGQRLRDRAEPIQAIEPEGLLMSRDLKDAVRGRVADRLAGADMLLAEFRDDFRPGGVAVAENPGDFGTCAQLLDQLGWKRRPRIGKQAPGERNRDAGQLPVAGWRVLPVRSLGSAGESRAGIRACVKARRHTACGQTTRIAEAHRYQVGNAQRAASTAAFRCAGGTSFGDVQDRVGPGVAIGSRIGCAADAHRVHDENERACHGYLTSPPPSEARTYGLQPAPVHSGRPFLCRIRRTPAGPSARWYDAARSRDARE